MFDLKEFIQPTKIKIKLTLALAIIIPIITVLLLPPFFGGLPLPPILLMLGAPFLILDLKIQNIMLLFFDLIFWYFTACVIVQIKKIRGNLK